MIDLETLALAQKLGGGSGGGKITDGIVVKARDADGYATEIDFYGDTVHMYEIGANVANQYIRAYWKLQQINFKSVLTTIAESAFNQCTLPELIIPNTVQSVGKNAFRMSRSLETIIVEGSPAYGQYPFYECMALKTAQLGGIGYATLVLDNLSFGRVTQTDLTITIYTTGARADSILANIRNGATGATIIIKASEDTTYNGTAYKAGDTMITSEVSA